MSHPCASVPLLVMFFVPAVQGQGTLIRSIPTEYPLSNSWFHVNEETKRGMNGRDSGRARSRDTARSGSHRSAQRTKRPSVDESCIA